MVKSQVQIPDHLFKETKRIAVENEMSFAQVVRMGFEMLVRQYPAGHQAPEVWRPPEPLDMGAPLALGGWTALCHEGRLA